MEAYNIFFVEKKYISGFLLIVILDFFLPYSKLVSNVI